MGHLVVSEATDSTHQRKKDKMLKALLLLGLVAAAHAGLFIQDGQEYEYRSIVTATAGTMDVATHSSGESYKMKVRLQASGRNLNVEISDLERSMFVAGLRGVWACLCQSCGEAHLWAK